MNEAEAYIALNMVPKIGPIRVKRLLEAFGSPSAVLAAPLDHLQSVRGMGQDAAKSLREWESLVDLPGELALVREAGAKVLTLASPDYPTLLREIHDPPTVLYILGDILERDRHAIGVIGTRKPSHYATDCAKKLSYQLAYAGVTVVSGLARGIDTAAHQAALAAKGRTIGVLGSGLLEFYPPENRTLADKIATSGAVVTEFSMRVKADRQTFPMRNRIISGCSFGVLVVEAGANSGALISANQAGEQGRSIYAVPGRIDNPNAIGSNRLIQQGAKLITSAADILDDMGILFAEKPQLTPARAPELSGSEQAVHAALGDEEIHIDALIERPRPLYLPSPGGYSGGGSPVFSMDGAPIGIILIRIAPPDGETGMGSMPWSLGSLPVVPVIVPAADLIEVAKQALEADR
jgi:DNA processing protein